MKGAAYARARPAARIRTPRTTADGAGITSLGPGQCAYKEASGWTSRGRCSQSAGRTIISTHTNAQREIATQ